MAADSADKGEKAKWMVLVVILVKVIMDGLDGSMLSIALPTISRSLGVSSTAIIWVVSSYSLTSATTVLFFGRLGDMIGKTRFYMIGIAIYIVSIVFSGMANSLGMLVAARVIQAIGAGCTMANGQGIIAMTFPEHQRGRALGIYGGALSLGSLAGPTLSGYIVANMSWQYIFWLKAPFGVLAFLLGLKFFPKDAPARKETMDYPGALLYAMAIVPLVYSLQEGYSRGYTSVIILSGLAVSFVSFAAFFTMQRHKEMPLLDLGIFKNPVYSVSIIAVFIMSFSNAFRSIITPFYMQGVLGTPPDVAGLYMSVAPVIVVLITPVSGFLSDRVGSEKVAIIGQSINFVGLLLMSTLTARSSAIMLVIFICINSIGSSLFQPPNNTLIMSNLPPEKLGIGGSMNFAIQNLSAPLGVAFTTAVLYGGMSSDLGYRVEGYVRDSGMDEAFMYGMRNTCLIASVFCAFGVALSIWRIVLVNRRKTK